MRRIISIVVIALLMALTFTTCGHAPEEEPEPSAVETPSPSVEPSAEPSAEPEPPEPSAEPEPPPYDGPVNPLTGLPCTTDISDSRPYAIMINNLKVAQPQLGVSKADIIYEVPVEGGITRMMAVFQDVSGVGVIGSVRSSRHYYVDLAQAYDAIYIHAGGSPQAYSVLSNRNITRLDGVNGSKTDIFYRDSQRRKSMGYEHSMVTSGELIAKFLPTYNFRLDHKDDYDFKMEFADDGTPESGEDAFDFSIGFSSSKKTGFKYNAADNRYYLSQHGGAYKDGNDGTQISVTNILVLKTAISIIPGDADGRLNVTLTGKGGGYFICGGKYIEIEWSKKNESSQFVYTTADGNELVFGRGQTYICILPNGNSVNIE